MRWNLMNFYLVVLVKLNMPTIFFHDFIICLYSWDYWVHLPINCLGYLVFILLWVIYIFWMSDEYVEKIFPMCRLPLHKWQFLWLFLSFYISCNPIAITIFFWSPCLRLWIEVFPLLILISLEISCVKLKSLMHFE